MTVADVQHYVSQIEDADTLINNLQDVLLGHSDNTKSTVFVIIVSDQLTIAESGGGRCLDTPLVFLADNEKKKTATCSAAFCNAC